MGGTAVGFCFWASHFRSQGSRVRNPTPFQLKAVGSPSPEPQTPNPNRSDPASVEGVRNPEHQIENFGVSKAETMLNGLGIRVGVCGLVFKAGISFKVSMETTCDQTTHTTTVSSGQHHCWNFQLVLEPWGKAYYLLSWG